MGKFINHSIHSGFGFPPSWSGSFIWVLLVTVFAIPPILAIGVLHIRCLPDDFDVLAENPTSLPDVRCANV
jgi:hypothetical protein